MAKTKPNKCAMAMATQTGIKARAQAAAEKAFFPKNEQRTSPFRSRMRLMSKKTLVRTVWMPKKAPIPPHPPRLVVS